MSTKNRRIGPRMRDVARIVQRAPGGPIYPIARAVGPHGSLSYGYRTVHRAIRAGLVRAERRDGRSYALFPAEVSHGGA